MPGKNKPKRLNRHRSWRVMRRKKRIAKIVDGGSRSRKPRPKKKAIEKVEVKKAAVKVKKEAKKVVKKVSK